MPKEVIRSGPDAKVFPEVRWNRDMDVQLAVVDGDLDESDPARGAFAELSRSAINRLIQVLRRARDQAYGADA